MTRRCLCKPTSFLRARGFPLLQPGPEARGRCGPRVTRVGSGAGTSRALHAAGLPLAPDRRGSCPGPGVGAPNCGVPARLPGPGGRAPGAGGLVTCQAGGLVTCQAGAAGPGRASTPQQKGARLGRGCHGDPRRRPRGAAWGVMAVLWRRGEGAPSTI